MRVFHDSRDNRYRAPFGAVACGTRVSLALDVYDAPNATVTLRTWTDGRGEQLLAMQLDEAGSAAGDVGAEADGATGGGHAKANATGAGEPAPDGCARYRVTFTPDCAGEVWYQFIVTGKDGATRRYGTEEGRIGGVGRLADWEPSSYLLTVYEGAPEARSGHGFNQVASRVFHEAAIAFLRGETSAPDLAETVWTLRETAPELPFSPLHNPLDIAGRSGLIARLGKASGAGGGHDAGGVDGAGGSFAQRARARMDDASCGLAQGRLWCLSLMLTLMPEYFPPCEDSGAGRPAARCGCPAHPWGCERLDCATIVRNAADIRRSLPLFEQGAFSCVAANDDVFCFWRRAENGTACVMVNASLSQAYDIPVALEDEAVSDVIGGYGVTVVDAASAPGEPVGFPAGRVAGPGAGRCAVVHLNQLGSAILYFHPDRQLDCPLPSGLGVLAHITSLPTNGPRSQSDSQLVLADARAATAEGAADEHLANCMKAVEAVLGDSGLSAADVIEQATEAIRPSHAKKARETAADAPEEGDGQGAVAGGEHDHGGTLGAPAFAFVDWLASAGVRYWQVLPANPTDEYGSPYAGISAFAGNVRLLEGNPIAIIRHLAAFEGSKDYDEFCEREADWLEPYVTFMAIRQKLGSRVMWQDWPKKYRRYDPGLIDKDAQLRFYAGAWRRSQYAFERQWKDLKDYANKRGISIIGDMPIYVSADSADVWVNQRLFQLGSDGRPQAVAGCPPDAFAEDGQVWGNPLYDWDALQKDGYAWWMRRLERAFDLYDYVRLDHFIGFSRYYSIPAGQDASQGSYCAGPGFELFERAHARFGQLPIIAEDLGLVTPAVRALCAACGFPGMDIVQFADGGDPLAGYAPRPGKIAYTGTHDNQTLVGYAHMRYGGRDPHEVADTLMRQVVTCPADVRIVPLQDVLGLGDEARMNTPGTAEGNWSWQARHGQVQAAADRARELASL